MTSTVLTDVLKAKTTNGSLTISGNGTGNVDMKNLATTDDTPMVLTLKTGETDIAAADVLGQIDFQAPDETTGTDAILVAAGISAISEGDFSSSNNATKLSFKTAASEAAAEKMFLSSAGNLDVTGDVTGSTLNADGDTAAGDNAAIGYTSAEGLILTGQGSTSDVTIKNDADAAVITVATGTTNVDVVGDLTAGTLNADGDTAASDNAAMGYTSAEGLILTGQGSTSDVTIKNDADAAVITVATGTTNVDVVGEVSAESFNLPITLNGTDGSSSNAGDNIVLDASASSTDVGERLLYEGIPETAITALGGAVVGADNTVSAINLKDYGEITNAIGAIGGGTQNIDLTLGNSVSATVSAAATTFQFTNPTASDEMCAFSLVLTNGGSQTINWPGSVDWAGGSAPSLTSSGVDILVFFTIDGGTIWHGMAASTDSK